MEQIQITIPDYLSSSFEGVTNVSVTENKVTFTGFSVEQVEKIVSRVYNKTLSNGNTFSTHDNHKVVSKSLGENELERIKQYLPETFDPKTMKAWKAASAFTMMDRDNDVLTKDYLDAMAEEANLHNPALVFMHNGSELKGTVFHSEVKAMDDPKFMGQYVLMQYFITNPKATLPGQPESNTIDYNLENGFLKYVSVSFGRYQSEFKQSGDEYVRIISRPSVGKVIHPELSLVYFGAQPGAGIKSIEPTRDDFNFKSFNPQILKPKKKLMATESRFSVGEKSFVIKAVAENDTVNLTGDVAALETELKSLSTELPALRKASEELKAAKQPIVNNIINLSGEKGLKKSFVPTEEKLMGETYEVLKSMETDLQKEFTEKNPQGQVHGAAKPEAETKEVSETILSRYN